MNKRWVRALFLSLDYMFVSFSLYHMRCEDTWAVKSPLSDMLRSYAEMREKKVVKKRQKTFFELLLDFLPILEKFPLEEEVSFRKMQPKVLFCCRRARRKKKSRVKKENLCLFPHTEESLGTKNIFPSQSMRKTKRNETCSMISKSAKVAFESSADSPSRQAGSNLPLEANGSSEKV